jgi:hypothetical protein
LCAIETTVQASRLTLVNVHNPQPLAGEIMNRAQRGTAA